jgi:hypothetical protein
MTIERDALVGHIALRPAMKTPAQRRQWRSEYRILSEQMATRSAIITSGTRSADDSVGKLEEDHDRKVAGGKSGPLEWSSTKPGTDRAKGPRGHKVVVSSSPTGGAGALWRVTDPEDGTTTASGAEKTRSAARSAATKACPGAVASMADD